MENENQNIAPAHPGWVEKHSYKLFTTANPILFNNIYKAKTLTKFPSLVLTKSHITYNQQKDQNRLWGEDLAVLKVLSTYVLGKLNVFGYNCHLFSVNCTEVGIFQRPNQICLCSFLQSQYGACLEVQVIFAHFKGYLTD